MIRGFHTYNQCLLQGKIIRCEVRQNSSGSTSKEIQETVANNYLLPLIFS